MNKLAFEQYSDVMIKDRARRSLPEPTKEELKILYRRYSAEMRYAHLNPLSPHLESDLKYIESELAECDRYYHKIG